MVSKGATSYREITELKPSMLTIASRTHYGLDHYSAMLSIFITRIRM